MIFYSYDEFKDDVKILAKNIKEQFNPDALLAIARGGLTLGHCLATALNKRELFCLNSIHYEGSKKLDTIKIFNIPDLKAYKKVLIIDDIVDSGESICEIKKVLLEKFNDLELKTATIFYKDTALLKPEFTLRKAEQWVEFYWDINL